MKVLAKDAKDHECHACEPGAFLKALDKIPRGRKKSERPELERRFRVVASCDKPVKNTPTEYVVCGARMCADHIGSSPQEGMHWCASHTPKGS